MQMITIERDSPLHATVSGVEWRAALRRRGDLDRPTAVLVDRLMLIEFVPAIAYHRRGERAEQYITSTLGRLVVDILADHLAFTVVDRDGCPSDIGALYRAGHFDLDPAGQGEAGIVLDGWIIADHLPVDIWIKRNPLLAATVGNRPRGS